MKSLCRVYSDEKRREDWDDGECRACCSKVATDHPLGRFCTSVASQRFYAALKVEAPKKTERTLAA